MNRRSSKTTLLILIALGLIFALDAATPIGYSVWLLYLLPLLASHALVPVRAPPLVAGVSCVLVLAGFLAKPEGADPVYSIVSRALGSVVFVVVAGLLVRQGKLEGVRAALLASERSARVEADRSRLRLEGDAGSGHRRIRLARRALALHLRERAGREDLRARTGRADRQGDLGRVPRGQGPALHKAYERAMGRQEPVELEEFYAPWNRWFENRIYPSPHGLSIYFSDVTERKLSEERIRELNRDLERRVIERTAQLQEVSDNGLGIASEHLEKVFEVFQRLHTQEEVPGSGIGLASVRKAVGFMDGAVWAESTPGVGSTYCVRLRAAGLPESAENETGPIGSGRDARREDESS